MNKSSEFTDNIKRDMSEFWKQGYDLNKNVQILRIKSEF